MKTTQRQYYKLQKKNLGNYRTCIHTTINTASDSIYGGILPSKDLDEALKVKDMQDKVDELQLEIKKMLIVEE